MKNITEITRRDIRDFIEMNKINWSGTLDETKFLTRLYNLQKLPSYDGRFKNFEGDIWQHRINNNDWDDYWIFDDDRLNLSECDDEDYLKLLCEMLHPLVRSNYEETAKMIEAFNEYLKNDGYIIEESEKKSGKSIYGARLLNEKNKPIFRKEEIIQKLSTEYVKQQITSMEASIETTPYIAIGIAKELIETVLKTILNESGENYVDDTTLPQLMKKVSKILNLVPKDIPDEKKGVEVIRIILGNLSSIVAGIGELRNDYGSGHGKEKSFVGLQPRHAQLAVGAATTLVHFLLETWEMLQEKKLNNK